MHVGCSTCQNFQYWYCFSLVLLYLSSTFGAQVLSSKAAQGASTNHCYSAAPTTAPFLRCVDALVSTTSSTVAAVDSTTYQWLWVLLVSCAWICIEVCLHQLSLGGAKTKAAAREQVQALFKWLLQVRMSCSAMGTDAVFVHELVQHWHDQVA